MLAFSSHFRYQLLKSFAIRRRRCGLTEVAVRSEEHTSELQSRLHLVCRLLLEKKNHRLGAISTRRRQRRTPILRRSGLVWNPLCSRPLTMLNSSCPSSSTQCNQLHAPSPLNLL